jgi:hypothetical protein
MITIPDYVDFLRREYLNGFIRDGGASVKFLLLPTPDDGVNLTKALKEEAERADYVYARIDAALVKVHMIDQVFFSIAKQVDWGALAASLNYKILDSLRFPLPPGQEKPSLEAIARYNNYDYQELRRDFNTRLQEEIFRDYELAQEFRTAMIRLCQAHLDPGPRGRATHDAILEWLHGELRQISRLKNDYIFQKIARHNARYMLYSLTRWIKKLGRAGLILEFDIRRVAQTKRSSDDSVYYTKPSAMDAYEVLRQLVDGSGELQACFVAVICSTEFVTDISRGLEAYQALKLRIWNEVRDRSRDNPYAALVRISDAN